MTGLRRVGLAGCAALLACDLLAPPSKHPFGAVVVRVQSSDGPTLRRLRCARLVVRRADDGAELERVTRCFRGPGRSPFPSDVYVFREGPDSQRRFAFELQALLGGDVSFSQQAELHLNPRGLSLAVFDLDARCVGVRCPPGSTCGGDGTCSQPVARDPLPPFDPSDLPPEDDLELLYPDDASTAVDASADAPRDVVDDRDGPASSDVARDVASDGCVSCDGDAGCADLARDPLHCGACGVRCGLREGCSAGRCVPVQVAGLSTGSEQTCAWMSDGTARCWGHNGAGALGVQTGRQVVARPVRVTGLRDVAQMAVGHGFVCARVGDRVRCQGPAPRGVEGFAGVTSLAAGADYVCVGGASGAQCVGGNTWGQLGDGTTTPRATPVRVQGLPAGAVTAVSAGAQSVCAVVAGRVACWGSNAWEQLGGPAGAQRCGAGADLLPCRPSAAAVDGLGVVDRVATLGFFARDPRPPVMRVTDVGVTCALERGGGVRCWGQDALLGVGPGAGMRRPAPGVVVPSLRATDVVTGVGFVCALEVGGAVSCWGRNDRCQLGAATDGGVRVDTPRRVEALSGVRALAAGPEHVCALRDDGEVLCWGAASSALGVTTADASVCAPARVVW